MKYWDEQTVGKIRNGYYSAVYFNRTKQILLEEKNLQSVTMQIFQKQESVICGIDFVLSLLQNGTGYFEKDEWIEKWQELEVFSLSDGDIAKPFETVMHIKGPYAYFTQLESLYLGILARLTKIATNTKQVVKSANGKPVIFFADRFDYFFNQELDGYAAKIGGAAGVATAAQAFFWKDKPMGTIPHSLIAMHDGNTIQAASSFTKHFSAVPLIVLVDFDNDCVTTAVSVAKKFGDKLFAIRLDTAETNVDKSINDISLTGVNKTLVTNVRKALDENGFKKVKIVVSGGFDAKKIADFEKNAVPVDMYGVGSSLLRGTIDFTADIVEVENKKIAKVGRKYKRNLKLHKKLLEE